MLSSLLHLMLYLLTSLSIVVISLFPSIAFSAVFSSFSVFSVGVSAVPPPDSEADSEESKKKEENNVEMMTLGGVVEGRNGWLTDVDCFGTNSFWHERKLRAELVLELGKEPETKPQTKLDTKLVVQCESPLGTAK